MDSRTIRTAILFSSAAVVLILLVVYAVNVSRVQRVKEDPGTAVSADVTGEETGQSPEQKPELHVIGENFTAYGEQIGNQPRAFMYDESFFDPMRDVSEGIDDGEEKRLTVQAAANGNSIHVSILNERGGLESGVAFQVSSAEAKSGREKTWTDTDRDGQIDITGLAGGTWRIRLLAVQGYEIPDTPVVVTVEGSGLTQESAAAGASDTAPAAAAGTGTTDGAGLPGSPGGDNLSGNDIPAWDSRPIIGSEGRKE